MLWNMQCKANVEAFTAEHQECKETKKNESTMMRVEREHLYVQTIDVIDQQKDIKQRLWSDYM